jgi:hypothetical protein
MRRVAPVLFACSVLVAQETVDVPATVHAAQQLRVKARADAQVARVFVAVGDEVVGLAQLVTLSAPDVHAELSAHEALVLAAEQHVQVLGAEEQRLRLALGAAERTAAAAHEATLVAKAQAETQEQATRSKEQLFEAGRAAADEVARQRALLLDAQRAHRAASEVEAAAKDGVELAKLDLQRAGHAAAEHRLQIGALRGQRDVWHARAQMLEVRSVLQKARVSRVFVGQGDVVRAGVSDLVELTDAGTVRIELHLPAAVAHRVAKGARVQLLGPGGEPGAAAAVARCSGVVEDGRASAWLDLDNKDGRWLPGSTLQVRVELSP